MAATELRRHPHQAQGGPAVGRHHGDAVVGVDDAPARRRGDGHTQVRVVEMLAAGQTLGRTFAKAHALDHPEEPVPPVVPVLTRMGRRVLADVAQALLVARVGRQPATALRRGFAAGTGLIGGVALLRVQHTDHVDHVARVVAVAGQVLGTQGVGLQFLLSAVAGHIAGGHALRLATRRNGRRDPHRARRRGPGQRGPCGGG